MRARSSRIWVGGETGESRRSACEEGAGLLVSSMVMVRLPPVLTVPGEGTVEIGPVDFSAWHQPITACAEIGRRSSHRSPTMVHGDHAGRKGT